MSPLAIVVLPEPLVGAAIRNVALGAIDGLILLQS